MKRSTTAALLSGLVFPGLGHLYLRKYIRGIFLAGAAGVLFYTILSVAMSTAFEVVDKMQSGHVPLDVESISELVATQARSHERSTGAATVALIMVWAVGIADSYREGRAREKA
ncbi:MAG: hypothetical protein M0Q95_14715 [Porticoccaceae bacterium]|nr:hypothetical protein [Porticoccaceae bacterium]